MKVLFSLELVINRVFDNKTLQMTKNDTKFNQNRSTLPSLLRILKFEVGTAEVSPRSR